MNIKIGRRDFEITNEDIVLDNSACYQLITKTYYKNWSYLHPVMSKTQFNKLLKENKLVLIYENMDYVTDSGKEMWTRKYRFNIE